MDKQLKKISGKSQRVEDNTDNKSQANFKKHKISFTSSVTDEK